MLRFNPTTPICLYQYKSDYIPGEGQTSSWKQITSKMSSKKAASVFYCEWRGGFGERALAAEAQGVKEFATLRMVYNPAIYSALQGVRVLVVKNVDKTAFENGTPKNSTVNLYELWGGVDDIKSERQFMEFKVGRYEAK